MPLISTDQISRSDFPEQETICCASAPEKMGRRARVECNGISFYNEQSGSMLSRKFLQTFAIYVFAGGSALACMFQKTGVSQDSPLPSDATQFVRDAITRELNAIDNDHSNWMYRLHREDEKNTQDRQIIETKEGSLAKVVLFNGQPLTPEQRQSDNERMRRQVEDQQERARLQKRDKADADKARQLLKKIPDAFFFTYDGLEDGLVRFALTPNPP